MIQTRFYLAGKISKQGWRNTIVSGDLEQRVDPWDDGDSKIELRERAVLGRFDYVGPYFRSGDHMADRYRPDMHGRVDWYNQDAEGHGIDTSDVIETCLAGIRACDVVFAWIESGDAYGTLVELGYARALAKKIWVAGPRRLPDMWFAERLASETCYTEKKARDAFLKFLPKQTRVKRIAIPAGLRFEILRRDDYRCQLCGHGAIDGAKLHIDHRKPLALGGTTDAENLWTLCEPCNLGKGAKELYRDDSIMVGR